MFVIELRRVAETDCGLLMKKGTVIKFNEKIEAHEFGRQNIEGTKYIASWEVITEEYARNLGYIIN